MNKPSQVQKQDRMIAPGLAVCSQGISREEISLCVLVGDLLVGCEITFVGYNQHF